MTKDPNKDQVAISHIHHNTLGSFTRTTNVTVFVGGIFDLLELVCKQHHRITLNPFLNGKKNGDVNGTCKRSLINGDRSTKDILTKMSSKIARPVHCELTTVFVLVHPLTADY